MAISFVQGQMLQSTLNRAGDTLTIANANIVYSNANVGLGGITPTTELEVAGTITVGNITISNVGNIDVGNVNIANLAEPVANADAATKYYVDSVSGNIGNIGNLTFSNTTISTGLVDGNITLQPTGNAVAIIDTTTGLIVPVGNTAQRPSPVNQGTVRYNTDLLGLEIYNGSYWDSEQVTNQTLNGDGSTAVFTLDRVTITAAALIMLNGVVQLPTTAYSVSGNALTFTEAPATGDVIDIRFL
jgi:hypothetical protein